MIAHVKNTIESLKKIKLPGVITEFRKIIGFKDEDVRKLIVLPYAGNENWKLRLKNYNNIKKY